MKISFGGEIKFSDLFRFQWFTFQIYSCQMIIANLFRQVVVNGKLSSISCKLGRTLTTFCQTICNTTVNTQATQYRTTHRTRFSNTAHYLCLDALTLKTPCRWTLKTPCRWNEFCWAWDECNFGTKATSRNAYTRLKRPFHFSCFANCFAKHHM